MTVAYIKVVLPQKRLKTAKNGKIYVLWVNKWFYEIGTFFWHILAKLKKKFSEYFFRKF